MFGKCAHTGNYIARNTTRFVEIVSRCMFLGKSLCALRLVANAIIVFYYAATFYAFRMVLFYGIILCSNVILKLICLLSLMPLEYTGK